MPCRLYTLFLVFLVFAAHSAVAGLGYPQESADSPRMVEVSVASGSVRRYEPDSWSTLRVIGRNLADQDAEAFVSVYLGQRSDLQYARRLLIPAGTQRTTWLPIRMPADIPGDQERIDLRVMELDTASGREVFLRREGEQLKTWLPLIVDHESAKTGLIFPPWTPRETAESVHEFYEDVIVRARESCGLSRVTLDITGAAGFIPPLPAAIQGLDQIVLADDQVLNDSAGLAALRHWIQQGGRIWLPLDRVGPEVVEALVGGGVCYEEVDRVELAEYTIEDVQMPAESQRWDRCEFEKPVELIRVFTDAADIHCTVGGWPAAFWQPMGQGEVLFTTLEPRGWARDREGRATNALRSLGARFFRPRATGILSEGILEPVLQEQIGYRVPSRGLAVTLLTLNCLGLLVAGVWLTRRGQLERLSLVVPAITAAATVVFLVIGAMNAGSVPPTVASMSIVRMVPETGEANVSGVAAVYHPKPIPFRPEMRSGQLSLPTLESQQGMDKRLIWDDDGASRWQNMTLSPGSIQFARFDTSTPLYAGVSARGTFGRGGFEGRLEGGTLTEISDAVMAAPPALPLAVSLTQDGSFVSGIRDVLPPGQYLADTLLSDEQRRRQRVLRHLLDPTDAIQFPRRPSLLFWSQPIELGLQFAEGMQRNESAIVAVPLSIDRTPPKTRFVVPTTFVRVEAGIGVRGQSSVFDPRTGAWLQDAAVPTDSQFRFVLPPQVLPCRLLSVTLTIKINAPSRDLKVLGLSQGRRVLIERWSNPSGVIRLPIEQAEVLQLDETGGLTLALVVSEPTAARTRPALVETRFNTWQIDYVRLDVVGETL